MTFAGSYAGSVTVKLIDTSILSNLVPLALIGIAVYMFFAPKLDDNSRAERLPYALISAMGFAIGYYDGVFGPGTGSFFTIGFVALFGFGITRAAANTKALNLTSNVASLAVFIPAGDVVWLAALLMATGQIVGGYLGAVTGMRHGAKLIKPMIVIVSVVLALKLLLFP